MSSGSWFQRWGGGAAIEKALSPFVFKRERGTAKLSLSEDLRDLEDESGVR